MVLSNDTSFNIAIVFPYSFTTPEQARVWNISKINLIVSLILLSFVIKHINLGEFSFLHIWVTVEVLLS